MDKIDKTTERYWQKIQDRRIFKFHVKMPETIEYETFLFKKMSFHLRTKNSKEIIFYQKMFVRKIRNSAKSSYSKILKKLKEKILINSNNKTTMQIPNILKSIRTRGWPTKSFPFANSTEREQSESNRIK